MELFDINGEKISQKKLEEKYLETKTKHDLIFNKIQNGILDNVWGYFDLLIEYNYYRVLYANNVHNGNGKRHIKNNSQKIIKPYE